MMLRLSNCEFDAYAVLFYLLSLYYPITFENFFYHNWQFSFKWLSKIKRFEYGRTKPRVIATPN